MATTILHEFRPTLLYRVFNTEAMYSNLKISPYFLTLKSKNGSEQISYLNILKIKEEKFIFWRKLYFYLNLGKEINFGWLSTNDALHIQKILNACKVSSLEFENRNLENFKFIEACSKWYLNATSGERWVTYREIDAIIQEHQERLSYLWNTDVSDIPMFKQELANHIRHMNAVKLDRANFRTKCNLEFEKQELKRYKIFFDKTLLNPLTLEQRKSIIVNEDAQLVVAAAGSGKTTTIKSKVAYIVHKGMAQPKQILVISFNKNVQRDLEKSLSPLYPGINIDTFHAIGLKILSEAKGQKPSLTELAESREKLGEYLDDLIKQIYEDDYFKLAEFFVSYAKPYRDQFDFKSMGEYIAYVRSVGLITLNGETVKSLEELELANFLYTNGVNYIYENAYKYPVTTIKKRQYRPDFYLPDYGIYIEHFAINSNGTTPSFIDEKEYLQSREWKILTHKKYATKLVQTFSHEKRSGMLTSNLRRSLAIYGVIFSPLPKDKLLDRLNSSGYISELGILLGTFLNLFKGSLLGIGDLVNRLPKNDSDATRAKKFIEIFYQIYQHY